MRGSGIRYGRWLIVAGLLTSILLAGETSAAVTGYRQEKNSAAPVPFTGDMFPDCSADTTLLFWAGTDGSITQGQLCFTSLQGRFINQLPLSAQGGDTFVVLDAISGSDCTVGGGTLRIACTWESSTNQWAPTINLTLQSAQEQGPVGGWTAVLSARPLTFQPERDILGETSMRREEYGESGSVVTEYKVGAPPGIPAHPAPIFIPRDRTFSIFYATGTPPAETDALAGELINTAGVLSGTGLFARSQCRVLQDVASGQTNLLFTSFSTDVTVKQVWCSFEGAVPTTGATFQLVGMTHGALTCASPTSVATPQTVTAGGAVPAYKPILSSVTNSPSPTTKEYLLCVGF